MKQDPLHHISFIDTDRSACVWVRIPLPESTPQNKLFCQKSFAYARYRDSWALALSAAKRWRDKKGKEIWGEKWPDIFNALLHEPSRVTPANNTSGAAGVSCLTPKGRSPIWEGRWRVGPPGARKTKRVAFSVDKHGFEQAKRLAIEAREQGIEEDRHARENLLY